MRKAVKSMVRRYLKERGYGDTQIDDGFDWADAREWFGPDRLVQLVLSYFSLGDRELTEGRMVDMEPVDWLVWMDW